jgi:hypothetical protein
MELPAGRYIFYHWSINTGLATITPKDELPVVAFTIEPGKAVYVGNFHSNLRTVRGFLGNKVIGEVYFSLGSEIKRDLAALRRLYPNLGVMEIVPSLPSSGPWLKGHLSEDVNL